MLAVIGRDRAVEPACRAAARQGPAGGGPGRAGRRARAGLGAVRSGAPLLQRRCLRRHHLPRRPHRAVGAAAQRLPARALPDLPLAEVRRAAARRRQRGAVGADRALDRPAGRRRCREGGPDAHLPQRGEAGRRHGCGPPQAATPSTRWSCRDRQLAAAGRRALAALGVRPGGPRAHGRAADRLRRCSSSAGRCPCSPTRRPSCPTTGSPPAPFRAAAAGGASRSTPRTARSPLLGLAALALLLGWHTRIASVAVAFLLIALQRRNVYVLNSGDLLLRELAIFVALMPAGECWSLDARHREVYARAPWALRLLQIQVSALYLFSVLAKLHGDELAGRQRRRSGGPARGPAAVRHPVPVRHVGDDVGAAHLRHPCRRGVPRRRAVAAAHPVVGDGRRRSPCTWASRRRC